MNKTIKSASISRKLGKIFADQIEALNWVQREIGNFGGNKNKVTLIGQGAGAINVDQLSISPSTDGYFDKIVIIDGVAKVYSNIDNGTIVTRIIKQLIKGKNYKRKQDVIKNKQLFRH